MKSQSATGLIGAVQPRCLLALFLAVTLASCAGTPPKRTPYSGPDNVGTVTATALVGNWNGRILNPLEGEQVESATYSFNEDGTWVGNAVSSSSGLVVEMESTGTWAPEGEYYSILIEDMKVLSDDPATKLLSRFLTASMKKQSGRSNPYEVSDNRIVLVSQHEQALELTRR
ncbi:MAG: hypothetical protein KTR33_16295 [Gammaproteobacteria bacterium]|nr:hypothetical protein [Gammaproteobacteria bacterium]